MIEEVAIPSIPIPQRHPLFGLWEGSFKVASPKGDEEIAETFFICSFNGERGDDPLEPPLHRATDTNPATESILPEQFSELPPDPRVPHPFLIVSQLCVVDPRLHPSPADGSPG